MMTTMTTEGPLTRLCERLAERLRVEGYEHPVAAAVALAVRGEQGVGRAASAVELGLSVDELAAVEEGGVALGALPAVLVEAAAAMEGLDVARLEQLVEE